MGNKSRRLNRIVTMLEEKDRLTVKELADELDVSEMTVRRDLDILEKDAMIDRSHGMASYRRNDVVESSHTTYQLSREKNHMADEKERIGAFAASLVEPGDVLIIDTGSTTDRLARHIPDQTAITVLCYNYNILSSLIRKPMVRLIFPGGFYHPQSQLFESSQGIELIKEIRATKIFLSCSGVHEKLGITCAHNFEVQTKRTALQSAETIILIADSSKFGKVRPAYFAQLEEVDMIITDSGLSPAWREIIEQAGKKLHVV